MVYINWLLYSLLQGLSNLLSSLLDTLPRLCSEDCWLEFLDISDTLLCPQAASKLDIHNSLFHCWSPGSVTRYPLSAHFKYKNAKKKLDIERRPKLCPVCRKNHCSTCWWSPSPVSQTTLSLSVSVSHITDKTMSCTLEDYVSHTHNNTMSHALDYIMPRALDDYVSHSPDNTISGQLCV